jgi:hypothetical protein
MRFSFGDEHKRGAGIMKLQYYPQNRLVMRAAKMALETGNANYILVWVPEESENSLKNLIEKTCCERSSKKNMQNRSIDWYFETVCRLHSSNRKMLYNCLKLGGLDENPIVLKVERAIETGIFEEISGVIPLTHVVDVKQRFQQVMNKRNYDVNNIAAGRTYVSAYDDFIEFVYNLFSGIPGKGDS